MAIQNFLSGGFYGSIGALTGRRWKNKRVVQKKFKPANPRTPAQQAQRNLFTRGSALAKIAQQMNWKAPQFENPIRTDWNQRQTVAINALKNGMMDWEALPLAPDNFKANHIIGTCSVSKINTDNTIEFVLQGTNLETSRNYACAIFIQTGARAGQIIVGSGQSSSTDATLFTARFEDNSGISGEECFIKIASYGDEDVNTVTLSAGIYLQQAGVSPYKFAPEIVSIEYEYPTTTRIKVKIGQEAIESYDPWENINIKIYGKVWDKFTAVNAEILDEENAQETEIPFEIARTTVAKTTATLTFTSENIPFYGIDKLDCKVDISFDAVNVKGVDSAENSQHIELLAQDFPEYIQPEFTPNGKPTLYANTTQTIDFYGSIALVGTPFAENQGNAEYQIVIMNDDWESDVLEEGAITRLETTDGRVFTGSAISDFLEDQSPTFVVNGNELGWCMQEGIELKSWQGTITGELYCNGNNPKIALMGFRVYTLPDEYDNFINVVLKP